MPAMNPAPAATVNGATMHAVLPSGAGIDSNGWSIRAEKGSIASTAREDELAADLGIKLPGMLFDTSALVLSHAASRLSLSFRAADALRGVGPVDDAIKVRAAKVWDRRAAPDVEIGVLENASDWTFTTRYPGTVARDGGGAVEFLRGNDGGGIDYEMLKRTDVPILYFNEVIFFEDELDDNGTASYKVRIRVMPGFFFVLARFFLRVDHVFFRVVDTRYFYKVGEEVLVRESTTREAEFETVRLKLGSDFRDADLAASVMPVVSSTTDVLKL